MSNNYTNDPVVSVVDNIHSPAVQGVNSTLKGIGVFGRSTYQAGVLGDSEQDEGVRGTSHAADHGGVVGVNDSQTDNGGPGVFGESTKGEGVRGVSHSAVHGAVV